MKNEFDTTDEFRKGFDEAQSIYEARIKTMMSDGDAAAKAFIEGREEGYSSGWHAGYDNGIEDAKFEMGGGRIIGLKREELREYVEGTGMSLKLLSVVARTVYDDCIKKLMDNHNYLIQVNKFDIPELAVIPATHLDGYRIVEKEDV